jgi:hypothetical protein
MTAGSFASPSERARSIVSGARSRSCLRSRRASRWWSARRASSPRRASFAFGWVDDDARRALFEAYGPIDEATRDRARFRALYYGVVLSDFGAQIGDEELAAIGRAYLARILG